MISMLDSGDRKVRVQALAGTIVLFLGKAISSHSARSLVHPGI